MQNMTYFEVLDDNESIQLLLSSSGALLRSHVSLDLTNVEYENEWATICSNQICSIVERLKVSDVTFLRKFNSDEGYRLRFLRTGPPARIIPDKIRSLGELNRYRFTQEELLRLLLLKKVDHSELLKGYQVEGVDWLANNRKAILADDMGLGKTAQSICALSRLLIEGLVDNAVVICPRALVANWIGEIEKWAPELCAVRVPNFGEGNQHYWSRLLGNFHIAVTHYDQFRKPPQELACKAGLFILDEAHRLRNFRSQIHIGIKGLNASRIWALTGTPIENKISDLADLISLLEPKKFPPGIGTRSIRTIKSQARPYLMRRLKSDVLSDLPKAIEKVELLVMEPDQKRQYEILKMKLKKAQQSEILSMINQLRSVCDLVPKTGQSIKADRCLEILDEIRLRDEKCIIFSYLLEPLRELQRRIIKLFGTDSCRLLEGDMDIKDRVETVSFFKGNESCSALLASARVGGEGLTLTEANHVIFFNEWWNPTANWQARDRVVRLGQEKEVLVHKLRCSGTIEERLDEILAFKGDLIDAVINVLAQDQVQ